MIIFSIVNSYSDGVKNAVKAVVGCGFFPDAVVGRELFFLPWPSRHPYYYSYLRPHVPPIDDLDYKYYLRSYFKVWAVAGKKGIE